MLLRYLSFLLFALLLLPQTATAALAPATPAVVVEKTTKITPDLSRAAVEAQLGRKLKFKERVALSVMRGKARRQARKSKRPPGGQLDTISLIAGILGILTIPFLFVGVLSALTALAALIMGIIGLGRTRRDGFRSGKGFAITGLVIGGLYYLLGLLALIFILLVISSM